MMAKRTALLGMLICLTSVAAFGQVGAVVVAPTNQGDIGLLTMPTADNPRAGQFTFGLYGWLEQRVAGPLEPGDPDRIRNFSHAAGEATFGLGLTRWWSVFVGAGIDDRRSHGGWQQGAPYLNRDSTGGSVHRVTTETRFGCFSTFEESEHR